MLIASGPDFSTTEIDDAALWDLAPTILHVHDRAVPAWMDGRVLEDALTTDRDVRTTDAKTTGETAQELSAKEQKEMQEQLSDLGYFD